MLQSHRRQKARTGLLYSRFFSCVVSQQRDTGNAKRDNFLVAHVSYVFGVR